MPRVVLETCIYWLFLTLCNILTKGPRLLSLKNETFTWIKPPIYECPVVWGFSLGPRATITPSLSPLPAAQCYAVDWKSYVFGDIKTVKILHSEGNMKCWNARNLKIWIWKARHEVQITYVFQSTALALFCKEKINKFMSSKPPEA